jgi:hypothetical protein
VRNLIALLCVVISTASVRTDADRLAEEIEKWSSVLAGDTRTDPLWLDAKKSGETALAQARDELRAGRRLAALEQLARAQQSLGAGLYVSGRSEAEHKELAAFEAEWKRVGTVLQDVVSSGGRAPGMVASVSPALVRALAELSLTQAADFYAASLEYGRNTEPQFGLYYLGAAQAQRTFIDVARTLTPESRAREPQLRSLRPEIDALQGDLLKAYRPPASIDRHSDFIVISAALKEAREQDAAGHRHAALLRYLQAAQRVSMLVGGAPADPSLVKSRLEEAAKRLAAANTDNTIGQLFVERARSALASDSPAGNGATTARAVALDVLPRYFAALEPARAAAPAAEPRITVTLVRWPFT